MSINIAKQFREIKLWKLFVILLLLRIPYLIAYYPGLMIWDTASSIAQFYGFETHVVSISTNPDAILSNHHMILLTLLMGGAVKLGEWLGSQNFGFFLLVIFQVALTNAIVVYGIGVLRRTCSNLACCIAFGIYAVSPLFSLWQITVSKDSLFSAFALLLIILLYQAVNSRGELFKNKKFSVVLLLTNLMIILTKPQGAYFILLTFIVVALVYRKHWIQTVCYGILPSVLYLTVFTGVILPACNVAVSGKQELWGFAFQQTARYVYEYSDEVTEQERDAIDAVLPYDQLAELYTPTSQDSVKFCYKQTAPDNALKDYLVTWARMFFKHPDTYIEATWLNIRDFFLPQSNNYSSYMPVLFEYSNILKEHDIFTLHNSKPYPIYNLVAVAIDILATNPITHIFFQNCFWVWLTIIGIVVLLFKKMFRYIPCVLPLILSILILSISPVVDIRYILLLIYAFPVLLTMITTRKETINNG